VGFAGRKALSASKLFRKATTHSSLEQTFRTHVLGTGAIGRDGQRPEQLETMWQAQSQILQNKLRNGSYQFTSYRQKLIAKGPHSPPRVVSIATARDRVALKALAGVLTQLFPESLTPLPQTVVGRLASELRVTPYDTYVRIDVKSFYPSVSHFALRSLLWPKVRQVGLRSILMRAISTPTVALGAPHPAHSNIQGVPQGLPISNLLAEIAMSPVDQAMQGSPECAYFRFVDDILVLCPKEAAVSTYESIRDKLASTNLQVHGIAAGSKSEIGAIADGFDYLGYNFGDTKIGVRDSSVKKLENTLVRHFTSYKYELAKKGGTSWQHLHQEVLLRRLNITIAGCVYEGVPRGWIHFFSQSNDMHLLARLDAYVSRLSARFNLPEEFTPKRFVRAYWHVSKPNASTKRYIINFDRYTDGEKRAFLQSLFPAQISQLSVASAAELRKRFRVEVRKIVKGLEMDVSEVS